MFMTGGGILMIIIWYKQQTKNKQNKYNDKVDNDTHNALQKAYEVRGAMRELNSSPTDSQSVVQTTTLITPYRVLFLAQYGIAESNRSS